MQVNEIDDGISFPAIARRVQPILTVVAEAGGRALLVGGCIRDVIMETRPNDIDVEIYGIAPAELHWQLETVGTVNAVGAAFGVFKVSLPSGETVDVSVPRRENRIGVGHRDFTIEAGPMTTYEAAARRDFTINAMAWDPVTRERIDHYGGYQDLMARRLQPVSDAFDEDPLRVLRGMQLAGRFSLTASPDFIRAARTMLGSAYALPRERIWNEWRTWALKSVEPGQGLRILRGTEWVHLYPELSRLIGLSQDARHHPEGDVWLHTLHVCDAATDIAERDDLNDDNRLVLMFAALCHDLGKAQTTVTEGGRITSPGHAQAGVPVTTDLLRRIGAPEAIIDQVVPLVREHMAHIGMPAIPKTMNRLAQRLVPASIEQWGRLVEADASGRPPLPTFNPAAAIVQAARVIQVDQGEPAPFLLGRHLIALGVEPGPGMGAILKTAYDLQLDGVLSSTEDALRWAQEQTWI